MAWLSSGCSIVQFRVQCGSVPGAAWLSSGCSVAQFRVGVVQYRVQHGSVGGCGVARLRVRRGQPLIIQLRPFRVVDTGGKFAAGIVDTSGKFAPGINNTRGTGGKICHWCG